MGFTKGRNGDGKESIIELEKLTGNLKEGRKEVVQFSTKEGRIKQLWLGARMEPT